MFNLYPEVEDNMSDSWFFEANFNGIPDDSFDDFFKNCDFPLENVETNNLGVEEDWETQFQSLDPPPFSLSTLSPNIYNEPFSASENNSLLHNKAPEVKQQACSIDASSTGGTFPCNNSNDSKYSRTFLTSSPVSVLESSSSCSAENPTPLEPKLTFVRKGTRSKRRRATTFDINRVLRLISSSEEYNLSAPSDSELETQLLVKPGGKKQKRKKNLTKLSCPRETKKPNIQQSSVPRKCTHCEVTETPQWREGPKGPKTLCNACGVRYRSGRLLPEYRPAASPTFVPSLHSNCHKKVIEMRNKGIQASY